MSFERHPARHHGHTTKHHTTKYHGKNIKHEGKNARQRSTNNNAHRLAQVARAANTPASTQPSPIAAPCATPKVYQRLLAQHHAVQATPAITCTYFEKNICRSCTWLEQPYSEQLSAKAASARETLTPFCETSYVWHEPWASLPESFRNKVKLAVTGTIRRPNLGILTDPRTGAGADLRHCPLPTLGIRQAIGALGAFIRRAQLQPYNVRTDQGVLKYVLLTESANGDLMVRFVVRRRGAQGAIFKYYEDLRARLPMMRVCSVNVQPEHTAIIEGSEEILVSRERMLPMPLAIQDLPSSQADSKDQNQQPVSAQHSLSAPRDLNLLLTPGAFFQTNTAGAQVMYRCAQEWLGAAIDAHTGTAHEDSSSPFTVWELYSGVGGFGLALARNSHVLVTGIETSQPAVDAANEAARRAHVADRAVFIQADAHEWVQRQQAEQEKQTQQADQPQRTKQAAQQETKQASMPDAVVVNPPRRGIGHEMAAWLQESGVSHILYSSCNVATLARDLEQMPAYSITQARVIDMFPHTPHFETVVLLKRAANLA